MFDDGTKDITCPTPKMLASTEAIFERPFGAVYDFQETRFFQGLRPWLLTNTPSGLTRRDPPLL